MLVNNAGISGRIDGGAQDPTTLDLDVVRTVLETNVFGVVRVTNAMLPLLSRAGLQARRASSTCRAIWVR